MSRGWVWLQLAIAWLPMWALFTAIIVIVHGVPVGDAAIGALRLIAAGAVLGVAVYKFASHTPWPHPFRLGFVASHVLAAIVYAIGWYLLISLTDSMVTGQLVFARGPGIGPTLVTGVWLYIMVAGVAYANLAAQRAANIQAHTARMQLDTLRSQLHPHFLFNALHTVVQLIPTDPRAATRAAEQLAVVLRTTIEDQRDLISLAEELAFVERYLAIESIRFGERLRVHIQIDEPAQAALLPSFALQTLVENAVRHAVAPRIEATQVTISATTTAKTLTLKVSDDGNGGNIREIESSPGTGLHRLRERMRWLYDDRARLELTAKPAAGFAAVLLVPQLDDPVAGKHDGNNPRE
ncbi:MAG: histidine kinase [Rudaea sp.]|nr:histidine kinase [Rudaea sp.]